MNYAYEAFDRAGKPVRGTIDAGSAADATELLRRQGLFVSRVAQGVEGGAPAGAPRAGRARNRLRAVTAFVRQLAVLVSTGTPVVEALAALEKQTIDQRFRGAVAAVRARVEEGATLSVALEAEPRYFDAVCRSLVAAGETSGKLDVMLNRLAELLRQQLKVRNALVGAMVYPCLLMFVAVGVLTTMLVFVLPRFAGLFQTLNAPLPPTTRALMAVSDALTTYWYVAVPAIVAVVGGAAWWVTTPSGRRTLHTAAVRLPKVRLLTRNFATARLARLIGVLMESRVQLLEGLDLARQAFTNPHSAALLGAAREAVARGEPLSHALSRAAPDGVDGLVHPSVCEAVRNGERTGQVGKVLVSMADFLDEENEVVVKSLTSILEPVILIVLGAVVGLVATSMFMPLFDLTSMTGSGGAP